ncbi:MAG: class I SAM-dependent methyltransferase [Acidimicrobiia bacterium]|nr:class I SAM-dependent methyltransferase [Acidimicrobiia bacterium]
MCDWSDLDAWWYRELAEDPSYHVEVRPLFLELLDAQQGEVVLDLGTGTGWVLEELGRRDCTGIGVEINPNLAATALEHGPVVVAALPDLSWCRNDAVDGVTAVLVLEHLADIVTLFAEAGRVTRSGGAFTLVVNHPQVTAPGSAPVVDPVDGEVFWRWGEYLEPGSSEEPAGDGTVTFHHRTIADLLTTAAGSGWELETLIERGLPDEMVEGDPLLALQQGLPRLLGVRWRRA